MTAPARITSEPRPAPRASLRPLPSTVEEWQTRPVPVSAWRHTGPFMMVVRTAAGCVDVEPGSWVLLDEGGQPVEVLDDDAFRARHEPRRQA